MSTRHESNPQLRLSASPVATKSGCAHTTKRATHRHNGGLMSEQHGRGIKTFRWGCITSTRWSECCKDEWTNFTVRRISTTVSTSTLRTQTQAASLEQRLTINAMPSNRTSMTDMEEKTIHMGYIQAQYGDHTLETRSTISLSYGGCSKQRARC